MIEREVIKDLDTFETKLIGPFTKRQFICCIIAGLVGISGFLIMKSFILTKPLIIITGILMSPILMCGYIKPYGIPLERFVWEQLGNFFAPVNRKYETPELANIEKAIGIITYADSKEEKKIKKARIKEKKLEWQELGDDFKPIR